MPTYSVIAPDGQMYGPADEATLVQWARDGRISAQTPLHCHETNARLMSPMVPSLVPFVGLPQPMVNSLVQAPYPQAQGPGGMQLGYAGPQTVVAWHQLSHFNVALVVVFHLLTFGIFSWIFFNVMHGKLPKNRHDDPSAAKAVLFFLIPLFNLYWHFFSYLRLMDRIDEQRAAAGLPPAANKGLFITASVLMFIPFANYVSIFILMPVFFGTLQSNVNGLVAGTYRAA